MKERFLLTGASGFLGGHFVLQRPLEGETIALYHSHKPAESPAVPWLPSDLRNEQEIAQLLRDVRPTAILHCGALAKIDECETQRDLVFQVNETATDVLASYAAQHGCRFLYVSTDIVFDGEHAPYSESSETHPLQVYGQSKLAGERATMRRSASHSIARCSVLYGKRGIGGTNFAAELIKRWKQNQPSNVFVDQIRCHASVTWAAQSIWELLRSSHRGIIHLGGANSCSRAEFATALVTFLGYSLELLHPVEFQNNLTAQRPRDVTMNVQQANQILSIKPLSLHAGIKLEWSRTDTQ